MELLWGVGEPGERSDYTAVIAVVKEFAGQALALGLDSDGKRRAWWSWESGVYSPGPGTGAGKTGSVGSQGNSKGLPPRGAGG